MERNTEVTINVSLSGFNFLMNRKNPIGVTSIKSGIITHPIYFGKCSNPVKIEIVFLLNSISLWDISLRVGLVSDGMNWSIEYMIREKTDSLFESCSACIENGKIIMKKIDNKIKYLGKNNFFPLNLKNNIIAILKNRKIPSGLAIVASPAKTNER